MTSRHIDRHFVICLHLEIVLGLAELATMLHVILVMVSYLVFGLLAHQNLHEEESFPCHDTTL